MPFSRRCLHSLIATRIVSTVGALVSLPDSPLNILQEKPTVPCGCISFPSTNTEGGPDNPRAMAFSSSISYAGSCPPEPRDRQAKACGYPLHALRSMLSALRSFYHSPFTAFIHSPLYTLRSPLSAPLPFSLSPFPYSTYLTYSTAFHCFSPSAFSLPSALQ